MWNPFRKVRLQPVLPNKTIKPAQHPKAGDAVYYQELATNKLRSQIATQQISMIHEQLASSALCSIRGGKTCPD